MYRIAGIDVHKKLLVIVIAELRADGVVILERRKFLATPEQMRKLAECLLEWEVEEVVMESTAQYWQPVMGDAGRGLAAGAATANGSRP